jgi:hypothetical protein
MVKIEKFLLLQAIAILFSVSLIIPSLTHAAIASYDLKPASSTYNTVSGTVSLDRNSSNQYVVSSVVKNLPSPLPGNGVYYLFWGLQTDGRANNLGPITNDSQITKTLTTQMTQFFITSEKERFPEFVSGPRIAQTDTIPVSIYTQFQSPAPTATPFGSPTARPSTFTSPTGAPETGLGGGVLYNIALFALGAFGVVGLTYSLAKKYAKK